MRLDFCVACGERDTRKLEHHHMIPRSAGGSDDDTNRITLCHTCHGKFHGYERLHIRALTNAGIAAARARGVEMGNPGCRTPEGRSQLAAAREAALNAKIEAMADTLVPIVRVMRPFKTWDEVAATLNADAVIRSNAAPWTSNALRRACKRLVQIGLVDAAILKRKPHARPSDAAVRVVAEIVNAQPRISLAKIADTLRQMGHSSPRGNAQWGKSSVKMVLDAARMSGLIA